jgi:AraC-like DNA-binding protein
MPNSNAMNTLEIVTDDLRVYPLSGRAMDMHMHAEGQLFSLKSGLGIVETLGGSWLFPPQRCGWIPPGHLHSVRSRGQVSGWSLFLVDTLCASLPKKPVVVSLSPLLEQLVMRVAEWEVAPPPTSWRKSFLEVLLNEITMAQEQPLHLPVPADARLKCMVEEISQAPEIERSLDVWARRLGMSARSLQREFQRETGMTIGQWRQQLRILISLEKLSNGMSVTDTCFAVGYKNVSAFIKAFRQTVGLTPLEYSKNQ